MWEIGVAPDLRLKANVYFPDVVQGGEEGEPRSSDVIQAIQSPGAGQPLTDRRLSHELLETSAHIRHVVLQQVDTLRRLLPVGRSFCPKQLSVVRRRHSSIIARCESQGCTCRLVRIGPFVIPKQGPTQGILAYGQMRDKRLIQAPEALQRHLPPEGSQYSRAWPTTTPPVFCELLDGEADAQLSFTGRTRACRCSSRPPVTALGGALTGRRAPSSLRRRGC